MDSKVLDQVWGQEDEFSFDLEQWVMFSDDGATLNDGEGLAVVRIHYNLGDWQESRAEIILIDTEETGNESDLVLRDFPSNWWHLVPELKTGAEAPFQLLTVAADLAARMANLIDPSSDD